LSLGESVPQIAVVNSFASCRPSFDSSSGTHGPVGTKPLDDPPDELLDELLEDPPDDVPLEPELPASPFPPDEDEAMESARTSCFVAPEQADEMALTLTSEPTRKQRCTRRSKATSHTPGPCGALSYLTSQLSVAQVGSSAAFAPNSCEKS